MVADREEANGSALLDFLHLHSVIATWPEWQHMPRVFRITLESIRDRRRLPPSFAEQEGSVREPPRRSKLMGCAY